jgi:lipid-A-disaccharide synthase
MNPRVEVARELAGTAAQALLLPAQVAEHGFLRDARRAALAADLALPPAAPPEPPDPAAHAAALCARPLELFLSCAEASGEIHGRAWLAALRAELARIGAPPPRVRALASPALGAADIERLGDPVSRAAMGLSGILAQAPFYIGLCERFARALRERPADLFLPVDSPALHVPLARIARRARAHVVHLVAPQYWGWAPWRAPRYRSAVDQCLCLFAFEPAWFEREGIAAQWVGHALWDELPALGPRTSEDGEPVLALLPGTRGALIERCLPWMLARAAALRARGVALSARVFQERPEQRERVRELVARAGATAWAALAEEPLHVGLRRCRAALSVSGTVQLDLLHQRLPTVVIYRLAREREARLRPLLLDAPYIALPNLLANRPLSPEHVFAGEGPTAAVEAELAALLSDPEARVRARAGLELAARRLGPPGAALRAARWTLAAAAARIDAGGTGRAR